jgi:hypothetical protein
MAPGYGAGWIELDPDADAPATDITLRPEQVIRGRLFDLLGQPARDVKLSVMAIRRVPAVPGAGDPREERLALRWAHPDDLAGWPSPAISGADGRFTLHGVGPGLRALLSVLDPRFISQVIEINTASVPARQEGRIVAEGSGHALCGIIVAPRRDGVRQGH